MTSLADRLAQAKKSRGDEDSSAPAPDSLVGGQPVPRSRRIDDPFGDLKRQVHQSLLDTLGPKLYDSRLTQSELEQKVRLTLQEVLAAEDTPLTVADRARIAQEIADDILGYGPLEPYLRDTDITEVMVNGPDALYVERAGRIYEVDGQFNDEAHLRRTIDKIVGRVGRRVASLTTRRLSALRRRVPGRSRRASRARPHPAQAPLRAARSPAARRSAAR